MLDIRALAYVSPVSEVPFASVELTVRLSNVADETGLVQGKFRVYNDTTGLLIHTSDITPLTMAPGATVEVSALTDFDPPAPADDVYFVIFEGHAHNALVPRGIDFYLGSFHFDVKPVGMGPAPAGHAPTHQLGGSDELEVSNLATAEVDVSLVLAPDGVGGVEWRAEAGGIASATFELFTANGTWTKPAGAKLVYVEVIGAGGGGGGGYGNTAGTWRRGGAGGGAGALAVKFFPASALTATVDVVIGAGGTAGQGGSSTSGTDGGNGGISKFGLTQSSGLWSFPGGGGYRGAIGNSSGGGGGGTAGAGQVGQSGANSAGGLPGLSSATALAGAGAAGVSAANGGLAEYGGGAGGGATAGGSLTGGGSLHGAAGGGAGGGVTVGNVEYAGGAGGATASYTAGAGSAGGAVGGGAGTSGVAGDGYSIQGGGGGGGGGNGTATGGAGGDGGAPGGGGGGGGGGTTTGGAGGTGGRGEVRVWVWF